MYIYLREAGGARRVVYLNRAKGREGLYLRPYGVLFMLTSIFPRRGEREE